MKSVLISIRPKWVEKIVNGEKTIEVRKTAPKEVPFKCYIYMTQGTYKDLGLYGEWIYQNRMKVIGEFICDKVIRTCGWRLRGDTQQCAKRTADEEAFPNFACLTIDEIIKYAGSEKREICGWHISDLKIYDKPKELSEFGKPCPYGDLPCGVCEYYSVYSRECRNIITRPPQSWCYVEEL